MALQNIITGKIDNPVRILLYGVEGVGKSTFAANAPSSIFLGTEDGTAHLDISRLADVDSWQSVINNIKLLMVETHDFKTLVIDTLDWLEPLLWKYICKRDQFPNIEAYGYGKGYVSALDEWRILITDLNKLRDIKKMNIILLAHSWIKSFKNPEGEDFDRYELKLHPKAGGLLKEWADAVLFCNHETFAEQDKKNKRIKGVSSGARIIYTSRTAAYDAKNRYSLPERLALDWDDFYAHIQKRSGVSVNEIIAEIKQKLSALDDATTKKVSEAIIRAGEDTVKLLQLNNWVNARIDI